MGLRLLSRGARLLVCVTTLAACFGWVAGAGAAGLAKGSLESPAVREAIAHEMQGPGPNVVTQGGQGGSSEPAAPAEGEAMPQLATAYSNTWRLPRRAMVSRIYPVPVNYRASDGAFHAIENRLVPAPLGGYENEANSFSLKLPTSLASGVSLTSGNRSASFALEGAKEAMPSVAGTTATYAEALQSTDFEYASTSTGVQEIATLKDTSAPQQLQFLLTASAGLQPRKTGSGAVELVDGQGIARFTIPAALAYRPGADPSSGRALASTLTSSGSGWVLSIDTGAAWLRAELETGAVAVDPPLEISGSQNCWIESDALAEGFCSQNTFDVGYQSTTPIHEHHGLLQFSLASLPADSNVLNAKLGLYIQSKSTSNTKAVGVYRATKPWTTAATWSTYDGTHSWTTAGGDYNNPTENSDASVNPSLGGATGWAYWYPTKIVQEWANGTNAPEEGAENNGFLIKDEQDNTVNNTLTFSSIRATSNKPYLDVTWVQRGIGVEPQYTILNTSLTDQMGLGVNVASGDLRITNTDLHVRGRGLDFTSVRSIDDLDPNLQEYGRWRDSNTPVVHEYADGSIEYVDGTDAHYVFMKKPDGTYITPRGIKSTVCTAGHAPCPSTLPSGVTGRVVDNQSGTYSDFNSYGGVQHQGDRNGNTMTASYTEGVPGIASWTDTQSRKFTYKINTETGFYTEIKDVTGERHVSYEYEGTGGSAKLTGYTDTMGGVTHYENKFGDVTKITTPQGHVIKLSYDGEHRIRSVTRTTNSEHTEGPTTEYTYDAVGSAPEPCTSKQKATLVRGPRRAHDNVFQFNVLDQVEKTIDAEKHESEKAKFDPFGNVVASTAPERETGASAGVTSLVYGTGGQNVECSVQGTKTETTSCPGAAMSEGYATEYAHKDGTYPYQATEAISARREKSSFCYWGGETACVGETEGTSKRKGVIRHQHTPLASENNINYEYNKDGTMSASTDADGPATRPLTNTTPRATSRPSTRPRDLTSARRRSRSTRSADHTPSHSAWANQAHAHRLRPRR